MNNARARVGVVISALLTILGTGLVLAPLASSASATAQPRVVGVCHGTWSDSAPYDYVLVDTQSWEYAQHVGHRDKPGRQWRAAGTWNGIAHKAGDPKRDYVEGLDAGVSEAWCGAKPTYSKQPTTCPPTTTTAPPATTTTAPPTTTTAPPATTTTAPPTTTTAPPATTTTAPPTTMSAPPATTTTAPPTTTTAPPATTTTAPPETEPGTVPPTTSAPGTTPPTTTGSTTPPARTSTPVAPRPPLADTGASAGIMTLAGLVLIALGVATFVLSRPQGKHS